MIEQHRLLQNLPRRAVVITFISFPLRNGFNLMMEEKNEYLEKWKDILELYFFRKNLSV